MAKRKRSTKRPQPRHKKNSRPSQFDKRARLGKTNPDRKKTTQAKVPLVGSLAGMVSSMASIVGCASRVSVVHHHGWDAVG